MIRAIHPLFFKKPVGVSIALGLVGLACPLMGQSATYSMTSGEGGTLSPTSSSLFDIAASDMAFFNIADTGFSTSQNSNGAYPDASGVDSFFSSTPKPGENDPYYAFTLTPESGVSIKLNSVSFGIRSLTEPNVPTPAPGPRSYDIYTSVDSFAAPVASGTLILEQGGSNYWYYYTNSGLDLTAPVDTPVEIQIHFREAVQGVTRAGCFRIDDVKISATALSDNPIDTWGGYQVESGHVDTGNWMGLLYIEWTPWAYSYSLANWMFLPEPAPAAAGAWLYVAK